MRLTEEQIDAIEEAYKCGCVDTWQTTDAGYVFCGDGDVAEFELVEDALSTVALHNNFPAILTTIRDLRRALEWYADAEHYRCRMQGEPGRRTLCDPVIMTTYNSKGDDGKLAREILGLES